METMRGHGDGSLFQRKSGPGKGRWVAVVTMRDGRRASRWAPDKDRAKLELAELLRLRDAAAPITRRIRLSDYLLRWVSSGTTRMAPATRRKHEAIARVHLVPTLGHFRLSELSVNDVERTLRGLDLGPQSRRHVRATLRRALADAVRDGLVTRNVAGLARPDSLGHTERTILDATQARRLIESTRTTRYGPLWTILVTTGLRISEALGLAWSDVDYGTVSGAPENRHSGSYVATGGRAPGDLGGNDAGAARTSMDDGLGLAERDGPIVSRLRRDRNVGSAASPAIRVRRQLARENGEWVHRPPKTAKGRRTVPLTPLGVEALRAQRVQQREWMAVVFGRDNGVAREGPTREPVDGHRQAGHEPSGRNGRGNPEPSRPAIVLPIDGLVFTSPTGAPLHETNTLKALQADLHAAGLPRVTQHDLRHSCATLLYSMGVPLETIADILGHSSVRVTQDLYRHRVQELQRTAADRMQEALG